MRRAYLLAIPFLLLLEGRGRSRAAGPRGTTRAARPRVPRRWPRGPRPHPPAGSDGRRRHARSPL